MRGFSGAANADLAPGPSARPLLALLLERSQNGADFQSPSEVLPPVAEFRHHHLHKLEPV